MLCVWAFTGCFFFLQAENQEARVELCVQGLSLLLYRGQSQPCQPEELITLTSPAQSFLAYKTPGLSCRNMFATEVSHVHQNVCQLLLA